MFRHKRLVNLLAEILGMPRKYDHGIVEMEYNCPHCDNGRNKFNLVINMDNQVFHCWACGYKGKVSKIFYDLANTNQQSEYDIIGENVRASSFNKINNEDQKTVELTGFRSLKVEWKDSLVYVAAKKYLKERGIDNNTISKWDMCYSDSGKYKDRIIIPSRGNNGKIEYFVARDIFDTQKLKYLNPPVEKTDIIFGEKFIDWKSPVIITEGIFDAIVMYNAIPLLGSKILGYKRLIRKIFENKTPVILGMDSDITGKEAIITISKYLMNLGVDVYVMGKNEYNDISTANQIRGSGYVMNMVNESNPFDELEAVIETLKH